MSIITTYEPSYQDLPMEIILKIMNYLNISDVFEAGATCRRWYEASRMPEFMARTRINLDCLQWNDHETIDEFQYGSRCANSVRMSQVDVHQLKLDFWDTMGEYITEMIFDDCFINEKTLYAILHRTNNLKSIEWNNCRDLFMCGVLFKEIHDLEPIINTCQNIQSVSFRNNRYLSDGILCRAIELMGPLVSLDLSGCHISFHGGLYNRFYPGNENKASESVLTFNFILQHIGSLASSMTSLDFSHTLIDSTGVTALAGIEKLRLEKLSLRACDQLTNSGIFALVKAQPNLIELNLSGSIRLTDPSLIEICRSLKQLKILKVRRCRALTDLGIMELPMLPQLECLDISDCELITSNGILAGIASKPNDRIIELHACALNICELAVIRIAENMPNLEVLSLSCCKTAVTDLAAQMIFKHLTNLRSLDLEFCDMLSDAGLTGMEMSEYVNSYEQLKTVEAAGSSGDGPDHPNDDVRQHAQVYNGYHNDNYRYQISLRSKAEQNIVNDANRKKSMLNMIDLPLSKEEINCSPFSINLLKGLRFLNLSSCNRITDVSLKSSFDFLELKELRLSRCQQVSLLGIEGLVKNSSSIEILDLGQCYNVCDKAIELISRGLKRLTHLILNRCCRLTDLSIDAIALNCKRLKQLDLRSCTTMSSQPQLRLRHIHSLRSILFCSPDARDALLSEQIPGCPPMPGLR